MVEIIVKIIAGIIAKLIDGIIEFGSHSGAASNLGLTIVTFADFSDYYDDDDYDWDFFIIIWTFYNVLRLILQKIIAKVIFYNVLRLIMQNIIAEIIVKNIAKIIAEIIDKNIAKIRSELIAEIIVIIAKNIDGSILEITAKLQLELQLNLQQHYN